MSKLEYDYRRLHGMCTMSPCSQKAVEGRCLCETCIEINRARQRQSYARRPKTRRVQTTKRVYLYDIQEANKAAEL